MPWLSDNGMWEAFGARTLMHCVYGDPASAGGAQVLLAALTVDRKALVPFTVAEGAGGHCEGAGRHLYHQRVYDWLDQTLGA